MFGQCIKYFDNRKKTDLPSSYVLSGRMTNGNEKIVLLIFSPYQKDDLTIDDFIIEKNDDYEKMTDYECLRNWKRILFSSDADIEMKRVRVRRTYDNGLGTSSQTSVLTKKLFVGTEIEVFGYGEDPDLAVADMDRMVEKFAALEV